MMVSFGGRKPALSRMMRRTSIGKLRNGLEPSEGGMDGSPLGALGVSLASRPKIAGAASLPICRRSSGGRL